ncbi:dihydrodipicolinate synthase family protein [Streptomyces sp. NPDC007025]|uniref:dihydrodipicolinate synthase family protein n=1 Tax=Streptomyces sp. NPDC007025 TaxID=3364771 RepID=UPI0036866EC8
MPLSTGPFGRVAAAMVTSFDEAGELDVEGARRLAVRLVDEGGCDALVLSGTTGESPATSDEEKGALVRAVAAEVGGRARVVAGVGSSDTRHTAALARDAEACGADGLLVVTPYYSRPTQEAVVHHLRTVADATGLPVMLYDIPGRTGTARTTGSLLRLAARLLALLARAEGEAEAEIGAEVEAGASGRAAADAPAAVPGPAAGAGAAASYVATP